MVELRDWFLGIQDSAKMFISPTGGSVVADLVLLSLSPTQELPPTKFIDLYDERCYAHGEQHPFSCGNFNTTRRNAAHDILQSALGNNGVLSTPPTGTKHHFRGDATSSAPLPNDPIAKISLLLNSQQTIRSKQIKEQGKAFFEKTTDYDLQNVVRTIMPGCSTSSCLWARQGWGGDNLPERVQVIKQGDRAFYNGLQTCKNAWCCPVCSRRIGKQRHREITSVIERHSKSGGVACLVTRSIPHTRFDKAIDLNMKLKAAERSYKSGKGWKLIESRFGILGTVRNVEITLGKNGWHPHIHEIYFLESKSRCVEFKKALHEKWRSAAKRAGLAAPSYIYGVDVRFIRTSDPAETARAAKYLVKYGIASELTGWQNKEGKDSIMPFDFLMIARHSTDERAIRLAGEYFKEYASASKHKRQLVFSKKLLALYPLPRKGHEKKPMPPDAEQQIEENDSQIVFQFDNECDWQAIRHAGLRKTVLAAVECSEDLDEMRFWITNLIDHAIEYRNGGGKRALGPTVIFDGSG